MQMCIIHMRLPNVSFGGLQVADAPLARQPADAKPAALAGEGRSGAASGKPARLGGTARTARTLDCERLQRQAAAFSGRLSRGFNPLDSNTSPSHQTPK